MLELLRKKKSLRILIVAGAAIAALAGAVYLYFHNPHSYPLPCVFYSLTGFYCPGCGAGRASYSLLHGRFLGCVDDKRSNDYDQCTDDQYGEPNGIATGRNLAGGDET